MTTELMQANMGKILAIRHKWPLLAFDLAVMWTPQSGVTYDYDHILEKYGITLEELHMLCALPAFKPIAEEQKKRLKSYGSDPVEAFKLKAMAINIAEMQWEKAFNGELEAKDINKFLELLLKSSIDKQDTATNTANSNVMVNITIPSLPSNSKLDHLRDIATPIIEVPHEAN